MRGVMSVYTRVKDRTYQDSLKLMRISGEIQGMPDILEAFAFMGTEINKKTRIPLALQTDVTKKAGPDDLILLVKSNNERAALDALASFDRKMDETDTQEKSREQRPATFDEGVKLDPGANLAIISVPGEYAAYQAMHALQLGLNVLLFSDHVLLDDEIALKDFALAQNLLMMGPDCGTAIIGGVPLCFANILNRGGIGVVGASGTGTQELTCMVDALGEGISHAIGTGGRDLSEHVDARMTVFAINLLAEDPQTKVIVVISKPPAPSAVKKVLDALRKSKKPSVLALVGAGIYEDTKETYFAASLEEGAAKAVALMRGENPKLAKYAFERREFPGKLTQSIALLGEKQKYIRGLFTGGTLAGEAACLIRQDLGAVITNTNVTGSTKWASQAMPPENIILDLGDDDFTQGAVHPMIDPSYRNQLLQDAFADPESALVLCDVVIGNGSHPDPAGVLAKSVMKASSNTSHPPIVITSITGTEKDPQVRSRQKQALETAGVFVFDSAQYAAETCIQIIKRIRERGVRG
jgi:FdrA protein